MDPTHGLFTDKQRGQGTMWEVLKTPNELALKDVDINIDQLTITMLFGLHFKAQE